MRLIVLGSGSTGNAVYVESGSTRVLVDAGLSARETARRMTEAGLDPTRLDAIVLTHEHTDHVKGAAVISKSGGVPVFVTPATRAELASLRGAEEITWGDPVSSSQPFAIGELVFRPFTIPHDGVDTFALTVEGNGIKAGVVTDLGYITRLVAERLHGCHIVVIESNHDRELLKTGPYPWSVKQRIGGNLGHLSNDETARWLREDFDGRARHIVLAHISRQCNHPELARMTALRALESRGTLFFPDAARMVTVAGHDRPSEWFDF